MATCVERRDVVAVFSGSLNRGQGRQFASISH